MVVHAAISVPQSHLRRRSQSVLLPLMQQANAVSTSNETVEVADAHA
jgi:hypothetical protein